MAKPKYFTYSNGQPGVKVGSKYYAWEEGQWVPSISPAQFAKVQKQLQQLRARDPGGDIRLF